jgi:DEAD/DEAH box helicase/MrfA Zn-binding domain/Helicase conserved C-terminal domain
MDSLTTRFYKDVFTPYLDLLKAEYRIHPTFGHARQMWEAKLTADELVNGPYLEKSQIYQDGEPLSGIPLHESTKATVLKRLGGRSLWSHQTEALRLILNGDNTVIATGTSSGKTLCYQIPILDDLVRDARPGLRAVIIYPLNALVNDQLTEWENMLTEYPQVTFARFTGQTPNTQSDYESTLKQAFREELADQGLTQHELAQKVEQRLGEQLRRAIPNRLNHRDAIRSKPPHVLITNFSMLEYLLERPVDAAIFENARLKFLVLDEAHAYRGVQATEIGFLIRRLKDRLQLERVTCIATSATLGKQGDPHSETKVRKFASDLFDEQFLEPNPIYGRTAEPELKQPAFSPTPGDYQKAVEKLRTEPYANLGLELGAQVSTDNLASLLGHDANLYKLRKDVLAKKPLLLRDAAKALWPEVPQAEEGLEAFLEIVAAAKTDQSHEDLLPTRLHYFVRAQDGLHVCLHKQCPGRQGGKPAFFVSRNSELDIPEGECPDCYQAGHKSKLVEVVTCRKCGYLYGALQDLGPRRAQSPDGDEEPKPYFDSFSTELGWMGDSYWSYFSVDDDLPYPPQASSDEEDEDQGNLFIQPAELDWCVVCGKKRDEGAGDNCTCEQPHLRTIKIFHRQCPHTGKAKDRDNLYSQKKDPLTACPNCGARNGSGLEPVHRFQESDDAMGLAMAIPLAHFEVSGIKSENKPVRKLLCFTDHRQRAAAFPSLLEEETFAHDMGREIVKILNTESRPLDLIDLGERLADIADSESDKFNPHFFLPVSRFPDEEPDVKTKKNLWLAETFAYFGVPDSARESAEDLGLVAVEYRLTDSEKAEFRSLSSISNLRPIEADSLLQVLLEYMRQRKAFTLPKGRIQYDAPAFGRVYAEISFVKQREGIRNTNGWLPHGKNDTVITDYLRRLFNISREDTLQLAENIWDFLTSKSLLIENKGTWKLDHERLFVAKPVFRYVCQRCGWTTAYSAKDCCPRKGCDGQVSRLSFDPSQENIIARWVAGITEPQFSSLKSEEHTAQINKTLAKQIEDRFREEEPRADGVNLLSSTTTFEMGINIGDLQKILLRNAPPSSASYVQRVGRAGRGSDKNSVCVTLCRRTKYDADAWKEPPRLMSGEVRTPTVFIENRVIAQRHFNAVVFAKYLRIKIRDERAFGQLRQKIRLEAFLSLDERAKLPVDWRLVRPTDIFLDFLGWLEEQQESDVFYTQTGRSLLRAVKDFADARQVAKVKYEEILLAISSELLALMDERAKLQKLGKDREAADIGQAVRNLLDSDVISLLARRGFLPRYAFPLDVVALETGKTRWSRDAEVELSRDRGLAIAEFAPGAQVIAHKKVFTSAGLYVMSKLDRPKRQWYSECPGCKQIRTGELKDTLTGPCTVCQRPITTQYIWPFVGPLAFSVRIDPKQEPPRYRRTTLIRQRQTVTHFIDNVEEASFQDFDQFRLALKQSGTLFRYNMGPESKGFMLCPECGYSEPLRGYKAGKKHLRLRPFAGVMECSYDQPWTKRLAYGHQFQSFCLIIRPTIAPASVESLAYALQRGLCSALDLESSDIGVAWRWLANQKDKTGAEIVLYDQTPGGAGFVKEGKENWASVIRATKLICESCTCEQACYDCLKSYGNQSHHEKLDRRTVVAFLS